MACRIAFVVSFLIPPVGAVNVVPEQCLLQANQVRSLTGTIGATDAALSSRAVHTSVSLDDLEHIHTGGDIRVNDNTYGGGYDDELAQILKDMEKMSAKSPSEIENDSEVKTTVKAMISKFEKVASAAFKKAFKETQTNITQLVDNLEKSCESAKSAKQESDVANKDLGECRQQEKGEYKTYKECTDDSEWMNKTMEKACQEAADAKLFVLDIDNDLTKGITCDFSANICPKLEVLMANINQLSDKTKKQFAEHAVKDEQCNKTHEDAVAKANECVQKQSIFMLTKDQCDSKEAGARMLMCRFGRRLQEQRRQLDESVAFKEKVRKGTGTSISEIDREKNWQKIQVMKCSLTSYTIGGDVGKTTKALCEGDVNYRRDVGVMDYMGNRTLALLSSANGGFTGTELAIQFDGPSYTSGNTSGEYVLHETTMHNISITPFGESPFEFCAANSSRARCRDIACPVGWKSEATTLMSSCVLKPCSIYECCVNMSGTDDAKASFVVSNASPLQSASNAQAPQKSVSLIPAIAPTGGDKSLGAQMSNLTSMVARAGPGSQTVPVDTSALVVSGTSAPVLTSASSPPLATMTAVTPKAAANPSQGAAHKVGNISASIVSVTGAGANPPANDLSMEAATVKVMLDAKELVGPTNAPLSEAGGIRRAASAAESGTETGTAALPLQEVFEADGPAAGSLEKSALAIAPISEPASTSASSPPLAARTDTTPKAASDSPKGAAHEVGNISAIVSVTGSSASPLGNHASTETATVKVTVDGMELVGPSNGTINNSGAAKVPTSAPPSEAGATPLVATAAKSGTETDKATLPLQEVFDMAGPEPASQTDLPDKSADASAPMSAPALTPAASAPLTDVTPKAAEGPLRKVLHEASGTSPPTNDRSMEVAEVKVMVDGVELAGPTNATEKSGAAKVPTSSTQSETAAVPPEGSEAKPGTEMEKTVLPLQKVFEVSIT